MNMRKTISLIALAVIMALPMSVSAQSFFGREHGATTRFEGGISTSSVFGRENATYTGNTIGVGNQGFGQTPQDTAPLGSGVVMLIAAGAGYALLKSKKSK